MSHGKDAARDLRYGRRGGRWAAGDPVDKALADLDELRERGIADGTWPGSKRAVEVQPSLFDEVLICHCGEPEHEPNDACPGGEDDLTDCPHPWAGPEVER